MSGYDKKALCKTCHEKWSEKQKSMELKKQQRRKIEDEKRRDFMNHLERSQQTNDGQMVPIKQLYRKLGVESSGRFNDSFVSRLPIKFKKIKNRYYCYKTVVDNFNIELYNKYKSA
jgi:hypothetical protein